MHRWQFIYVPMKAIRHLLVQPVQFHLSQLDDLGRCAGVVLKKVIQKRGAIICHLFFVFSHRLLWLGCDGTLYCNVYVFAIIILNRCWISARRVHFNLCDIALCTRMFNTFLLAVLTFRIFAQPNLVRDSTFKSSVRLPREESVLKWCSV